MHGILLVMISLGLLLAACGELNVPPPTATIIPSPDPLPVRTSPALVKEIEFETQTGTSYTLDWSPDGEALAVASGFEITFIRHDLTGTQAVLKPEGGALAVTWSPDQTQLATVNGYQNRTIRVWDWERASSELTLAQEIQTEFDQYAVFWSPDGRLLMTLADDDKSTFQLWDTNTWKEIRRFDLQYATPRRTMSWSADSSMLYGAGEASSQLVVFGLKVSNGSVQEVVKLPLVEVETFAFSPDGQTLLVADARGVTQIIDIPSGKVLAGFKSVDQPVDLAWSPDGSTLAILAYKTKLQLWSLAP